MIRKLEKEFLNFPVEVIYLILDVYEGDFLNDMRIGKGTIKFADGRKLIILGVYEGDFLNDMRSGKGTLKFADGGKLIIFRCLRRRFFK